MCSPPIRRLISQSTPILRRFAREAEQSVHLVMHDRDVLVVVAQVDGPDYWNVSVRVGSRIGIVNTGSGHVFFAFASDEERELMLEAARRSTARNPFGPVTLPFREHPRAGFRDHAEPAGRRRHQYFGAGVRAARFRCRGPYLPLYPTHRYAQFARPGPGAPPARFGQRRNFSALHRKGLHDAHRRYPPPPHLSRQVLLPLARRHAAQPHLDARGISGRGRPARH